MASQAMTTPGVLTVSPAVTATITINNAQAGGVLMNTPPTIPASPRGGPPQVYYQPNSRQYVLLVEPCDANGVPFVPGTNATGYVAVSNLVSGAVLQASQAMNNGTLSFNYLVLDTKFPYGGGPLLLNVSVYDNTGSGGVHFGALEQLLLPLPITTIAYRRNQLNGVYISEAYDHLGVLCTTADSTFYLTVTDLYTGASLLAQTQMTYVSASNTWQLDIPVFAGEPVLKVVVDCYSNTGVGGGVHRAQWTYHGYRG